VRSTENGSTQEVNLRHPLPLAAAAMAVALLASGCGSSSTSSTAATSASATSTTQTATTSAAASTSAATSTAAAVLISTKHSKLGTVLASGKKRLTVYLFEADKGSTSACNGECAKVWPPVTASGAVKALGSARAADLGTITRADGTKQVTYKGHPLYFYAKDDDDGDTYGQGSKSFGAEWYVLAPSGKKIDDDDDGDAS
jgi:predicted lipoprotein with Yx(FWY)xxD motif